MKTNIPKITVLMPVYNCELYIKEAVDSILNQTFIDFEFLIIDDASTDETLAIIKSFCDPRIQLIEKPLNTGYTNSLNQGLKLAKGEYIARMDGDDISVPERFEKQVSFLDANPDIVLCGTLYKVIGMDKICQYPLTHEEIKVKLISGCYIAHPTVMIRKSIFNLKGLEYDSLMEPAEDYDLWSRIVFLGKVANIGEVLLEYRIHANQTSALRNKSQLDIANDIKVKMLKKIIPIFPRSILLFEFENLNVTPKLFYNKLKESITLWNSLLSENNKIQIYNPELFREYQKSEKLFLFNLLYKKHNVASLKLVLNIFCFTPEFFKYIGIKKSFLFIARFFKNEIKSQIVRFQVLLWLIRRLKHFSAKFHMYYFQYFTRIGFSQLINYKSIPIIIISFNQLFYLKELIGFLKKNNYLNIIIIDNNSTYKPLLDYFDTIESTVTLHRLNENLGHLVFWKNKMLFERYSKGYYVVTDADIVPISECPDDFVLRFKKILDKNFHLTKVGFSLKIDDIPETNPNKQKVIDWESQFWINKTYEGNYIAPIDTTFALYRPNYVYNDLYFYKAFRTDSPYQASHGGWYLDFKNLTEEQVYYFATCNDSSSWSLSEKGIVRNNKLYT